ncbi:diguanylate cyclase domain-containing protein (plasmid) [Catenovulum sp. SX2]|uniref:sensor domain-containing diguanylate cyclase n=1 Tax=Catenovulum sp. SX2 TaxID=3398614 RepID=UPI003F87265C
MSELEHEYIALPIKFIEELNLASDLEQTLACIASWCYYIFDVSRVSITLYNEDSKALTVFSLAGNTAIELGTEMPVDGSFVGQVFQQRQADLYSHSSGKNYIDTDALARNGIFACFDVPLIKQNVCYSTLNFGFSDEVTSQYFDQRSASTFANFLSVYIYMHYSYSQEHDLARKDPLTKLPNRRALIEDAKRLISQNESNLQYYLLLIDIDYFKNINDTFGHDFGDKVLVKFAQELSGWFAKESVHCYRLGGEEFVVLIEKSQLDKLDDQLESLTQLELNLEEQVISISTSIGLSQLQTNESSIAKALSRADQALYRAKDLGRGLVIKAE